MLFAALSLVFFNYLPQISSQPGPLEVSIRPEKPVYLLGEPVFLRIEVLNISSDPVVVDNRFGAPCGEPEIVEVIGARRRPGTRTPTCSGGRGASCGFSLLELQPGEKRTQRMLLDRLFVLDRPGASMCDFAVQCRFTQTTNTSKPLHRWKPDLSSASPLYRPAKMN